MSEPIIFEPIAMERVWGGRRLESLLGKSLPHGVPIGESWEIVDRDDVQSVVHKGIFRGKTLHELWDSYRKEIFGAAYTTHPSARFPLLIKLLDARERLSVQVHPPAHVAKALGGEPKTEAWYVLDATPGARIYAGLKRGTTRSRFEALILDGKVEKTLHEISVHAGDHIFIPSGCVHALGEGNLILELQQNSDTTYRIFDWNRVGLNDQPRELHIERALASINFDDFEADIRHSDNTLIADCPFFRMEKVLLETPRDIRPPGRFAVVAVLKGNVACGSEKFHWGQFFTVPADGMELMIEPLEESTEILVSTLPV